MFKRTQSVYNIFGVVLFWCWNVLALLITVFLFGFVLLIHIIEATFLGEIPLSLSLCFLILLLAPFVSVYLAFKRPQIVLPLFYGVEMPIVTLTLCRVFLMRDMTWGANFFLGTAFLAIVIFGWTLWKNSGDEVESSEAHTAEKPAWRHYLHMISMSVVFIAGLISAVLTALYAFPYTIMFFKAVFSFDWFSWDFLGDFLFALAFFFFLSTVISFFVFPIYLGFGYTAMWRREGQRLRPVLSPKVYKVGTAVCVGVWVSVHGLASWQPQADYVQKLSDMNASEQRAEMKNPETVRASLVRGYLNEYRYLGTTENNNNLKRIYREAIGKTPIGEGAQSMQNYILSPLLYKGGTSDKRIAGELYSKLFDVPIQRAEKALITKALEATYDRDQVTAGLMNIGARNVYIEEQNITVEDAGDYAVVEIEEVYENQTFAPQEIFYYFSLPEDAALTGIWIGRTENRNEMDHFIVAPRGAAQQVYEAQVRQRIDPAILEQVGPGQYRLRVFPIPVTKRRAQFGDRWNGRDRDAEPQGLMRVHMRYVTPRFGGGYALPTLLEKRNVDWRRGTKRTLNGKRVKKAKDWMPRQSVEADLSDELEPTTASIADQQVTLRPRPDIEAVQEKGGRYAILVDTSYSMSAQKEALQTHMADLQDWSGRSDILLDYFVSRADETEPVKLTTFTVDDLRPFGQITPQLMLTNFETLRVGQYYDGVIIVMDQGRYASQAAIRQKFTGDISAPLWILHAGLGSSAYDDDILDLMYRSGGGVASSVKDLRARMHFGGPGQRATDNGLWTITPSAGTETSKNLMAMAARQTILMGSFGAKPDNQTLDRFHDLAKTYDLVSPYSSMIVLVNDRQREALKKATEADDRFDREGRSGEETLTSPNSPLVSGVPEPHEWLLIFLSLLLLVAAWKKRDRWSGLPAGY